MGIPDRQLAHGEQKVLTLRTHPKTLFPHLLGALLVLALAGVLVWFLRDSSHGGLLTLVVLALAVVALVPLLLVPVWRWQAETYTFTNRRLVTRSGIIHRTGRDIPLYRINDIAMDKDVSDRLFGCGTLIVSDATEKGGVVLRDIPRVEKVQVVLQELLHAADDGSDDGNYPPTDPRPRRR